MGEFLDAFNAGQQARQNRIQADQRRDAAEQKKARDQLDAAEKWVSNVLSPIAVELHHDLAPIGNVGIANVSRPPLVAWDITIALNGHEPTTLSFHIQNEAITTYRDGSQGNTIGAIATISQVQIKNLFREVVKSLGEA